MAGETTTSLSALLKQVWPQDQIYDELAFGMPGYALMRKEFDLAILLNTAVGYGPTQGISNDFGTAKKNKQPSSLAGFKIPPGQIYSLASIDRQAIALSRGKPEAIIGALDRAAQQAILGWKFEASTQLWGNAGGALTAVTAINGSQITITTPDDMVKFYQSMTVVAAPDDGTAATGGPTAPRSGSVLIGKVNANSGSTWQLQCATGNWTDPSNIPGLTVGDYLFRDGSYGNFLLGVGGWLPSADPTAGDNWCSKDRSVAPLQLAGIRVNGTNLTPRQAAMRMIRESLRWSANPTHAFYNPTNLESLMFELQAAGNIIAIKAPPAAIGGHVFGEPVDGIKFQGTAGEVKVFGDPRVPTGTVFGLELESWYISGAGDFPVMEAGSGIALYREEWSDSFELRVLGDLQVICLAPGRNTRMTVSA
jgi:hypothetical protein